MSEPSVLQDYEDGVLVVTLNRPRKRNAFDDPQWDGLRDALNRARGDDSVAVVVLTGAGDDFSAGQDLSAFRRAGEPRADGAPLDARAVRFMVRILDDFPYRLGTQEPTWADAPRMAGVSMAIT